MNLFYVCFSLTNIYQLFLPFSLDNDTEQTNNNLRVLAEFEGAKDLYDSIRKYWMIANVKKRLKFKAKKPVKNRLAKSWFKVYHPNDDYKTCSSTLRF